MTDMSWMRHFILLTVMFCPACPAFGNDMDVFLSGPVRMIDVLYYRDGGTTGFIVEVNGIEERFCLDGRVESISGPQRHVYLNATHPSQDGAKEIPIGGDEEARILSILSTYLDSELSAEEQSRLLEDPDRKFSLHLTKLWWTLRVKETLRSRQRTASRPWNATDVRERAPLAATALAS